MMSPIVSTVLRKLINGVVSTIQLLYPSKPEDYSITAEWITNPDEMPPSKERDGKPLKGMTAQ
jgi:hypothetical protein